MNKKHMFMEHAKSTRLLGGVKAERIPRKADGN